MAICGIARQPAHGNLQTNVIAWLDQHAVRFVHKLRKSTGIRGNHWTPGGQSFERDEPEGLSPNRGDDDHVGSRVDFCHRFPSYATQEMDPAFLRWLCQRRSNV